MKRALMALAFCLSAGIAHADYDDPGYNERQRSEDRNGYGDRSRNDQIRGDNYGYGNRESRNNPYKERTWERDRRNNPYSDDRRNENRNNPYIRCDTRC